MPLNCGSQEVLLCEVWWWNRKGVWWRYWTFLFPVPMWSNWSSNFQTLKVFQGLSAEVDALCNDWDRMHISRGIDGSLRRGRCGPTILPNPRLVIWNLNSQRSTWPIILTLINFSGVFNVSTETCWLNCGKAGLLDQEITRRKNDNKPGIRVSA